jgi:signal transduction histidine kinase
MRALLVLLIYIVFAIPAVFGQGSLQPVPGFPSQQVYDLLVDRKGFVWIAHELGVTRYDGLTYTNFSNPHQASLAITDLVEDRFGRIWCHNFSAQVFYVENERLHWLQDYDFTKEDRFPRMVLNGDDLLITTTNGLFVCNTANLQSRYITKVAGELIQVTSLAVFGNKVICYGAGSEVRPRGWYIYSREGQLQPLKWNPEALGTPVLLQNLVLQPVVYRDTLYANVNPFGIIKKLLIKGDSIYKVQSMQTNDFVNTISRDKDMLWINNRVRSVSSSGKVFTNLSISDITTDRHGNIWVGSVKNGLLVDYKQSRTEVLPIEGLDTSDFVRSIALGATTILYGTQNGRVIVQDKATKRTTFMYTVPFKTSAIDVVRNLGGDYFLFGTSNRPFVLNGATKEVIPQEIEVVVKDMDLHQGVLSISAISGLLLFKSPFNTAADWAKPYREILQAVGYKKWQESLYAIQGGRTDAICFDRTTHSILASFKDGVYEFGSRGKKPLELLGERVYASSLKFARGKLLIGTISNGLLIRKGNNVSRLSINEGLASNSIIEMKVIGKHLWLFQNNAIQILDIDAEEIISEVDLPVIVGSTMVDVAEIGDTAYLTSTEGLYRVPLKSAKDQFEIKSYINYVVVNNRDTILGNRANVPFSKNDILFHLAAPWYSSTQSVFFKYRLVGGTDEGWKITREPLVHFASLMSGNYRFESYAMHPSGKRAENIVSFEFEVLKPWWEQWWFRFLVLVVLALGFYALYRYRVSQLLKVESIRRNISSDLHDDIGATLSSINIYTELAKRQDDNKEFLNLIQENTREIIGKLDDLVWSINPKNDSCEQLINRMRSFSEPLLSGANINYKITTGDDLHKLKLDTGIKRNVYLIFKETINNVAKHSKSKNCTVDIYYQNKRLYIQIADDGVGFDEANYNKGRNGLKNIQDRARQIKANIKIDSVKNRGTKVQLEAVV